MKQWRKNLALIALESIRVNAVRFARHPVQSKQSPLWNTTRKHGRSSKVNLRRILVPSGVSTIRHNCQSKGQCEWFQISPTTFQEMQITQHLRLTPHRVACSVLSNRRRRKSTQSIPLILNQLHRAESFLKNWWSLSERKSNQYEKDFKHFGWKTRRYERTREASAKMWGQ